MKTSSTATRSGSKVKPLHRAINCDESDDEYYLTKRLFKLNSGSPWIDSQNSRKLALCCSLVLSFKQKTVN